MNRKKYFSAILISLAIVCTTFLFYEYKTVPLNTTTVPFSDARNVSGTLSPLAKNITIRYLGNSETIFLVLSASNDTKTSSGNYIIVSTVKIQQQVKFPYSSITSTISNLSSNFDGITLNYETPSFSGSTSQKIAELYNVPFSVPGNYTVRYTIGIKPIIEIGFLHFTGKVKLISFNSTLVVTR